MKAPRGARPPSLDAEQYRTLVEQVPVVVYTAEFGEHGRWTYVSPQIGFMLGFSPEEWLEDPSLWYERMVPEDHERAMCEEADSRKSGGPLLSEYRLRSRDGRIVWVRDQALVVNDRDGRPAFFQGILADITLQKEAEGITERLNAALEHRVAERTAELQAANRDLQEAKEAAELANRAKSEFLSRMSHELRTPLNAILGFGQLLETSTLQPDDVEGVQQILKGGRHLLGLINEVLDISRIESRTLSLSIEPVSVDEVIREASDLVLPLAAERGVELQTSAVDPNRFVRADRQRLKQVMLNLLANAVKYNREGGWVRVIQELRPEGTVTIKVMDSGPGIQAKQLERLFFPFERLGAEGTGVEGTGLGLALTKALVEAMGGSIGVESKVGRGSAFSVALPLAEAPDAAEGPHPLGEDVSGASSAERKVLYIEDNPSNLHLIERIVADRPGLNLLTAIQGRMGLELARQHRPDLIVVDVHLPDISGEEVVRALRRDPVTRSTPVIVTSADGTLRQRRRLIAAGANDYLTKPLDLKRFLAALDGALGAEPREIQA